MRLTATDSCNYDPPTGKATGTGIPDTPNPPEAAHPCYSTWQGCPGYSPPPVSIGPVTLPANYPHVRAFQQVYNQIYQFGLHNSVWPAGLEGSFRALFLACQSHPVLCGPALTAAVMAAGPRARRVQVTA